jgi:hypothetical protein
MKTKKRLAMISPAKKRNRMVRPSSAAAAANIVGRIP